VFVGDLLKGIVASAVGLLLAGDGDWWLPYVATGAAMVGHAYPVFAGFRGGRSVLTMVGGLLVFAPLAAGISVAVLLVVFVATRSFAWAARVGIAVFPFVQLVVDGPYPTAASGALMTFVGFRFWIADRHVTRGV
jgi:acyl phosphate:glycerol-3-phosphate acyltransferase